MNSTSKKTVYDAFTIYVNILYNSSYRTQEFINYFVQYD